MKEAAGEANMTVITIVLIGIVLAIGGVIIKNMMGNAKSKGNESNSYGCTVGEYWNGSECVSANDTN